MTPLVTVVIPAFNRPEPLKYTLRSVAAVAAALPTGAVEAIVVDDGSAPPLADQLAGFGAGLPITFVWQENQGSIMARLHGLRLARGEFIQFLDSDDLLHPGKLGAQIEAQRRAAADVSYVDIASVTLTDDYGAVDFQPARTLRPAADPIDLYLRVQPLPHSPLYRRDYLQAALAAPAVPAMRAMDPAGDVWLYYNLLTHPARLLKVDGPFAAVGPHDDERFSGCWEKLGVAALLIVEAFQAAVPMNDATRAAHAAVGETAFASWRRLPWDFSPAFQSRLRAAWRCAPRTPLARLGGRGFVALARLLGPAAAGWLLRRSRNGRYADCRTISDEQLQHLLQVRFP